MSIAVKYVQSGLSLVPIPSGRKGPLKSGWNILENTVTDVSAAARLTENIGLSHAYCKPTPTMALDIDDMERASAWLAGRGVDVSELLDADDAVQIVSGRLGRGKLLYRLPAGLAPIESLTIKEEVLVNE